MPVHIIENGYYRKSTFSFETFQVGTCNFGVWLSVFCFIRPSLSLSLRSVVSSIFIKVIFKLYHLHFYAIPIVSAIL